MQQVTNILYFPKIEQTHATIEVYQGKRKSVHYVYDRKIPLLDAIAECVQSYLGLSSPNKFIIAEQESNSYIAIELKEEDENELVKCSFTKSWEAIDGEHFDTKKEAEKHSKVHLLYNEIIEQVKPDFRDFDLREVLAYLFKNHTITKK